MTIDRLAVQWDGLWTKTFQTRKDAKHNRMYYGTDVLNYQHHIVVTGISSSTLNFSFHFLLYANINSFLDIHLQHAQTTTAARKIALAYMSQLSSSHTHTTLSIRK